MEGTLSNMWLITKRSKGSIGISSIFDAYSGICPFFLRYCGIGYSPSMLKSLSRWCAVALYASNIGHFFFTNITASIEREMVRVPNIKDKRWILETVATLRNTRSPGNTKEDNDWGLFTNFIYLKHREIWSWVTYNLHCPLPYYRRVPFLVVFVFAL